MTDETFDVVVVGARCAGSATARLLAQGGLNVLVLDKAAFPSETVSTHGVGALGIRLLEKWGLLQDVLDTGVPWEDTVGVKFGDLEFEREIPPGSVAPMCPRRIVLDHTLAQAARASGVELRERARVRELIVEDGAVVGLRYTDRQDGNHEVRARLVIGADGRSSLVAKAVKAEDYDVRPSRVGFRYAYFSGIPIKRVELAWSHPFFAYVFPTNDDLACMAGATEDAYFDGHQDGLDQALIDLFEAASPRLAAVLRGGKRESKFFVHRAHAGRLRVPYGPGWALVGDAGYFRDPVTGQGITDAFVGAQLLSDAVLKGFRDPAAMQGALARYQEQRDGLIGEGYPVTQQLASLEWTNEDLPNLGTRYAARPEEVFELLGISTAPV